MEEKGFGGQISAAQWLASWASVLGLDQEPAGTGTPFPAGSLTVPQEHYNLLVGDKPVRSKLVINTVPVSNPLRQLSLQPMPAPLDVPYPTGATGLMCSRSTELASVRQRFGAAQENFVNELVLIGGRNPADPPGGDITSCSWLVGVVTRGTRLTRSEA